MSPLNVWENWKTVEDRARIFTEDIYGGGLLVILNFQLNFHEED